MTAEDEGESPCSYCRGEKRVKVFEGDAQFASIYMPCLHCMEGRDDESDDN